MIKRRFLSILIFFEVVFTSCTVFGANPETVVSVTPTMIPKQEQLVFVEFFAVG